ncbi:hypothetical protein HYPGJ_10020 [Hyphomicrobium sp. GJ21]|nr:hypothetical protein HYPGJ_10020 [Hyphomicrobium sp. GJ21]
MLAPLRLFDEPGKAFAARLGFAAGFTLFLTGQGPRLIAQIPQAGLQVRQFLPAKLIDFRMMC